MISLGFANLYFENRVVARCEGGEGVDVPEEDGLVQPGAGHLFHRRVSKIEVLKC